MTEPPDPSPAPTPAKSAGAFLTIGELAAELGVAAHVLRYWESRFEQLRPLQRAGGRRYYRPADAELARRVHGWLTRDGYTVKGVQGLLARGTVEGEAPAPAETPSARPVADDGRRAALVALRDELAAALRDDEPA